MTYRIADGAGRAHALGVVVGHVALCGGGAGRARRGVGARVHAVALPARLVAGAVPVDPALVPLAEHVGVAVEPLGAAALRGVGPRRADGVDGAGVVHEAGVEAVEVVADLVVAAVGVDQALHWWGKCIVKRALWTMESGLHTLRGLNCHQIKAKLSLFHGPWHVLMFCKGH